VGEFCYFQPKTPFISKTLQDGFVCINIKNTVLNQIMKEVMVWYGIVEFNQRPTRVTRHSIAHFGDGGPEQWCASHFSNGGPAT